MSSVDVTFKTSGGKQLSAKLPSTASVVDCKQHVAQETGLASKDGLKIIYRGRILKDEETFTSLKIEDSCIMHAVGGKPASAPSTSPPTTTPAAAPAAAPRPDIASLFGGAGMPGLGGAGMPGMGGAGMPGMGGAGMPGGMNLDNVMQSPMFQQAFESFTRNPDALREVIRNNPFTEQLVRNNPQMEQVLNDPQALNEALNREMPNLETIMQQAQTIMRDPAMQNQISSLMQNPQVMQNMASAFGQDGGMGGFPGSFGGVSVPGAATATTSAPAENFTEQLRQLETMGFVDSVKNLEALRISGGDVNSAIAYLLDNPN